MKIRPLQVGRRYHVEPQTSATPYFHILGKVSGGVRDELHDVEGRADDARVGREGQQVGHRKVHLQSAKEQR